MIAGSFGLRRGSALVVAAMMLLVLAAGWGAVPRGAAAQPPMAESIRVIVQKASPADPWPELAVRRLGGQVTRALPIVAGFAATVPAARAGELAGQPGVRAVTPDAKVRVQA
ncbi:MAG TPA: peptidase S8 and S53 subtilisin kexin sedolisin, partial [Actinomycetota bacterium]|nr:peptidase S8 and S53 subtilisin kexin sedolisin [Actinomycetota bacterium]